MKGAENTRESWRNYPQIAIMHKETLKRVWYLTYVVRAVQYITIHKCILVCQ